MTRKKKVLLGVLLIPVVLVVGAWVFLDQIARRAVEIGGEQAMGVPTALDGITLKPLRGEGSLEGLKISNPKGFETPFFMNLSNGSAALDMGSLFKDTVVMKTIDLDGLEAHLEKTSQGSNYGVIIDNMKKGEEAAKTEEPGKKFLVQTVVVRNIRVHAEIALGQTVHLNIDEVRLEEVGSDTGSGVIMSQLMGTIVKAVLAAIVEQGAELIPGIAKDLGSGLGKLGAVGAKVTVKVAGKAVKVLEGVGKAAGGVAKDAIKGIGGIFGGDDEEDK
jgi:hypothetical protein